MDFHGLTRKDLQTLCKKNKIPANMTNVAMADALSALQCVEGLDELMNQSSQSQENVAPITPSTLNRTRPTNSDSKTALALTRTTRKTKDQENKNVAETPAASPCTGRRITQVAASSARMKTRQSVRLLEKTIAGLSLKDKARAETVPVKIDFLCQTHESDNVQHKNKSGDDEDTKDNTDEIGPVDVSVAENDASREVVISIADKVSDEISAKVTDYVDVEADQREDQINNSQQLKIGRGTDIDFKILEADSNKFGAYASDANANDDSDSHRSILIDEAVPNQVSSKGSASDADADDDSDSQKSVGIQQEVNLITEADSNQVSPKGSASDTDADNDSDSHKSVGNQQRVKFIAEADSNPYEGSASDADDDLDSQKYLANQQVNLIAEAHSNQFSIESIDAEADMVADDDSGSQKSAAECVEELVDVCLMEAYEEEKIPYSNSVKEIIPSPNTMKNFVNVQVIPAEEFGMTSTAFAKQKQVNLITEAKSNQVSSKKSASDADADADAEDDSDFHESVANQQVNLIAEADANQFSTESIAAEADVDADDAQKKKSVEECVEELVDVSLIEAYEDEIPNSNSEKQQISPSSPENTMKNLVNVPVMQEEEFGWVSTAIAKQKNDSDSGRLASNQVEDNEENIVDSSGITKLECEKDKVKKSNNNIVDEDSELKSLNDKSLRQLNKMLKEKLQISNKKKNNEDQNITQKQVGNNKPRPRPALQKLPENQMLAGEPK